MQYLKKRTSSREDGDIPEMMTSNSFDIYIALLESLRGSEVENDVVELRDGLIEGEGTTLSLIVKRDETGRVNMDQTQTGTASDSQLPEILQLRCVDSYPKHMTLGHRQALQSGTLPDQRAHHPLAHRDLLNHDGLQVHRRVEPPRGVVDVAVDEPEGPECLDAEKI